MEFDSNSGESRFTLRGRPLFFLAVILLKEVEGVASALLDSVLAAVFRSAKLEGVAGDVPVFLSSLNPESSTPEVFSSMSIQSYYLMLYFADKLTNNTRRDFVT